MADVKSSPGVMLFEVTRLSRDSLPERITEEIRGIIARAPSPPDS
jgi:hypothetical protein